ncbi:hypothetical protein P154DRAFT_444841 [Amniculicola lignicola CBS 123094]|uniref:N-acetyltransferase domain-containing protein n=1 Tax=Amniculicola lignicola CBS 123094 TaxID=1392246 RepID=A0A6A5W6I5_9PLEO|nr:hypothetical protein P154DRAFT_444841 [Amniculicola lignicola CBS 123094]
MGLPKSPPSPPFSAVDPKPVANAVPAADTDNQWGIWVESPAGPSGTLQASRWADASGNAAGGAGRGGRSGRAQPFRGRRTPWPKARDMKPVPVESDGEDGGVACKSDSNGDEWYDVRKLCDWEGKIQPPPVERVECNFTDRHFGNLGARMEAWLNKAPKSWMQETTWHDKKYDILRHLPKGDKNTALEVGQFEAADNAAVVPEYWMPEIIDGKAPQDFWRAHKTSAPAPLSDISLVEQPWWEEYPDDSTVFLKPFEMPNAKVDPNDVLNHNPEIYCSSEIAVTNKKHAAIARQRKLEAKRNRPNVYRGPPLVPVPDRRLKPAVNIYLRPVAPADTAQITEIYNYYVAETIKANEFNPRTTSQLATRIDQTIRQGLPWIVAVLKSNHPNQGKGRQVGFVSETIVGFASIDDHTDPGSMWRFAFELELYVHHEYHRKGVASCLLDRLIDMVSTGYQCRGGYEWRTPSNYLRFGSQRVVKVVNFNYPHENRGRDPQDEDLTGVTKLLEQFNFRRVGHLKNMGAKYSKMVDLTIFQHETSEFIEKELKPSNPL